MMPEINVRLHHIVHELLALQSIQVPAEATFSDAIEQIKQNAIQLPKAKPAKQNSNFIDFDLGLMPIEPMLIQPSDSVFPVGQALLWLAANKNRTSDTSKLEQQLAELITSGLINIFDSYNGYNLFQLIIRSGSKKLVNATTNIIASLGIMELCDALDFLPPDQEDLRVSAIKSGCLAAINLVTYICQSTEHAGIINQIFLSDLADLIEQEENANDKLALEQGLATYSEKLKINTERARIAQEQVAYENIKVLIRNEKPLELNSYITSPANEDKLKPLLHFAIDEKKHASTVAIAMQMKKLGLIDENDFLNLCAKHTPPTKFYELLEVNKIILSPNFGFETLNKESIKFIIKYYPEKYKDLINMVASKELKSLVEDDLLLDLFVYSENTRIAIMKRIAALQPNELLSLATKVNNLSFLSCALASGVDPSVIQELAQNNNYDFLSIILLAASYPNTLFNTKTIESFLQVTDPKSVLVTESHLLLAKKLNNSDLYEVIFKRSPKSARQPFSEIEIKIEDITHLQGALRIFNRANEAYPNFLEIEQNQQQDEVKGKVKGEVRSYFFWMHSKSKERHDKLLKNHDLGYLALKYIDSHCVADYPYDLPLYLLVQNTSQHVKRKENYASIMDAAYLLSETARANVGISHMPTMLDTADKAMRDQDLVCTAPFKTAFSTERHYCTINFNLEKMPPSYLRHAVIKLGDYVARKQMPIHIQIAPDLSIDNTYESPNKCQYTFSYKDGSSTVHSVTVDVPGRDEIYHGINGFKESICHMFYVIDSIPDTPEGNLIKSKIIEHFSQLDTKGELKQHLDSIFTRFNEFMEIDFPGGLPLSFKYVDSIYFIDTKTRFKPSELYSLIEKGSLSDFKEFFTKYPQLKDNPFIIREILTLVPAYRLHEMTQILEELSPAIYLLFTENLIELINLSKKDLMLSALQSSVQESKSTKFDLGELMSHLKTVLSDKSFAPIRKQLMETYQKEVVALRDQIKALYATVEFDGNNSKMREILTNPNIIHALTGKNQNLLAAILAFEIEAELESKISDATSIRTVKSQQSGEFINYTLGSILSSALAIPQFFTATCPLNKKDDAIDEAAALRTYIKQKSFAEKLLLKMESALVDLCQSYEHDINLNDYLITDEDRYMLYNPEVWEHDGYLSILERVYAPISGKDFSANPNIPSEVNEGLSTLLHALYPDKNIIMDKSSNILNLSEISLDAFLKDFLATTHILNPKISHFLFDTLHFGVALTREDLITKIQLKDTTISFKDLIEATMKTISQDGINNTNPVLAEQLALRTKMLESWCIEKNKLTPHVAETTFFPK